MDPEIATTSSARKWWMLLGGIVVFVVGFELLGSLFRTDPTSPTNGSTPAESAVAVSRSPAPPELRRLEDGAIEIRHDFFRRSTIRIGDEEDAQALFECLSQGIEETFGDGTEGWRRGRVRSETQRIQDECLGSVHELPVLPRLPEPGG